MNGGKVKVFDHDRSTILKDTVHNQNVVCHVYRHIHIIYFHGQKYHTPNASELYIIDEYCTIHRKN